MHLFKVIISNKKGEMVKKEVEAEDIAEATRMCRKYGNVIKVKKVFNFSKFDSPLKPDERQIFLHRLSAMLISKVTTGDALSLMESTFGGQIGKMSGKCLRFVENGHDIGQAIKKIGQPHFPATTCALIEAGTKGGESARSLKNAAEFEYEMDSIKRGSMMDIYVGLFIFLLAVALTFGTTRYMGPMMAESQLMQMVGEDAIPQWAIIMGQVTEILMGFFFGIFVILSSLGTFGRLIMPSKADKIILKIPFYKDLVLSKNNFVTLYSLSLLVKSGVSTEQSLFLASESSPKGALRDDLKNAVSFIKKGQPWAGAMVNFHPTDRAALGSALDREGIVNALDALSTQYRALYKARITALAPIIKGVSAVFLMTSGAVLFGLTLMPILKMAANGIG